MSMVWSQGKLVWMSELEDHLGRGIEKSRTTRKYLQRGGSCSKITESADQRFNNFSLEFLGCLGRVLADGAQGSCSKCEFHLRG